MDFLKENISKVNCQGDLVERLKSKRGLFTQLQLNQLIKGVVQSSRFILFSKKGAEISLCLCVKVLPTHCKDSFNSHTD